MEAALSYPQLKFLAAELVQQGFIFKEAAFPLGVSLIFQEGL